MYLAERVVRNTNCTQKLSVNIVTSLSVITSSPVHENWVNAGPLVASCVGGNVT
jgi:hypothetical protein